MEAEEEALVVSVIYFPCPDACSLLCKVAKSSGALLQSQVCACLFVCTTLCCPYQSAGFYLQDFGTLLCARSHCRQRGSIYCNFSGSHQFLWLLWEVLQCCPGVCSGV